MNSYNMPSYINGTDFTLLHKCTNNSAPNLGTTQGTASGWDVGWLELGQWLQITALIVL